MKEDKGKEKQKPEEGKATTESSGGMAESVLDSIGNLVPGLGGVIRGLKNSDAFRERLAAVDEEIDRRLKETPLKRTDSEMPGGLTRRRSRTPGGTPPSASRRGTRRRKHSDTFTPGHGTMDKGKEDVPVDIFEEDKKIRVIADLPGINEEDIRIDLNEDTLAISASRGNRSFYKNVKLPRASENIIAKTYNNGILEVTLG